jgi:subtilisin family serine protease
VDRMELDKKYPVDTSDGTEIKVDIAILDTGIASHTDLSIYRATNCARGPWWTGSCKDGSAPDGNGHGTHVAGTAAAKDNGNGVVGVAPGARLWAVKVLNDQGSGYMSWIAAGVDWVTKYANDIEVANMSLGCECTSQALNDALTRSANAGVVYVVAAGNNAKDASTFSPANHDRVIAVSAVADFDGKAGGAGAATCRADQDDTLADFSNYGSIVDIAAPGVCITSTWPGGGYNTISGTSMASPHGAGAAALYIVEKGIAKSSNRWQTVRSGLQGDGWSVPQSDACGFTSDKSGERFLMLVPVTRRRPKADPQDQPPRHVPTI